MWVKSVLLPEARVGAAVQGFSEDKVFERAAFSAKTGWWVAPAIRIMRYVRQ
jgi:hypothetical protein